MDIKLLVKLRACAQFLCVCLELTLRGLPSVLVLTAAPCTSSCATRWAALVN